MAIPEEASEGPAAAGLSASGQEAAENSSEEEDEDSLSAWSAQSGPDEEIQRLQDFLDDNKTAETIEQAKFLAESEDPRRRDEAVDAMLWVSTPEAGGVLLPLLSDSEPEVAERSLHALTHILATLATQIYEDPESGDLMMNTDDGGDGGELLQETYDLWVNACKAASNEETLEELLMGVIGLDVKFSVPVLVDVVEATSGARQEKALEYLDIATHGDGVTNREEAARWLMENSNN